MNPTDRLAPLAAWQTGWLPAAGPALPCALLLLAACASAPPPGPADAVSEDARVVAFTDVTVVAMTPEGGIVPGRTVVVRDGRIAEIGAVDSVRVPEDALLIDSRGRYLMPGLADMHVHLEHSDDPALLGLFVANGVTTVRNMDGRPYILTWREDVASGALTGPTIHTAGPILDGDPPFFDDNVRITTPEEARVEVLRQARAGYDFIKTYVNLDAESFRAIRQTAADAGLRVAGHAPRSVGLTGLLDQPIASLEHLADFAVLIEAEDSPFRGRFHWSKLYLGMPADSARMDAAARRIAATRMSVVPTLVERARSLADEATLERWLAEPDIAAMPRDVLRFWRERVHRTASRMSDEDWQLVERGRANRAALLRALHGAGVPLLVGTDTPNPFVVPGAAVHEELAAFVAAGLSEEAALSAATREAARFLGQLDEWGTVETGKRADLLLLTANPFQDVGAAARPVGVMLRGRWIPADRLTEMRRALR
jgi:hypothetical protein